VINDNARDVYRLVWHKRSAARLIKSHVNDTPDGSLIRKIVSQRFNDAYAEEFAQLFATQKHAWRDFERRI
jgi:hypothetical protein